MVDKRRIVNHKTMVNFKGIKRYCIDCGSSLDLALPKKERGKLIVCCSICSLPYTVEYVCDHEKYDYVMTLKIETEFDIYKRELEEPEAKLYNTTFIENKKKHKQF